MGENALEQRNSLTPLRSMIWIQPVPDEGGLRPDFVSSMVLRSELVNAIGVPGRQVS